ncbi:unnamed protein product [Pylaiella littoralis]
MLEEGKRHEKAVLEGRWMGEQATIAEAVIDTDDVTWNIDTDHTAPPPPPPPPTSPPPPEDAETAATPDQSCCVETNSSEDGTSPCPPMPIARRVLRLVGGVDISFVKGSEENACATLVVLQFPSLKTVYEAYERVTMDYPYMSGFLAFREVNHLARLVGQLRRERPDLEPDVTFVDGNGRLHPRGAGLACHLGVVTGLRTVGLGKTFLHVDGLTKAGVRERVKALLSVGEREMPLLGASGTVWGMALVPKEEEGKKAAVVSSPVFVSVGHRVSLETCVALTKAVGRYRVPEPVRQADMRSREVIREWLLERRGDEADTKQTSSPSSSHGSSKETGGYDVRDSSRRT